MTFGTPRQIDIENERRLVHVWHVTLQAKLAILVICHVLYFLLAAPAGAH